jgi:NAD(P)H-flavin reductase
MSGDRPFSARLVRASPLAPDVRHLVFEAQGAAPFRYSPGQYVALRLCDDASGLCEDRYYSIASPPAANGTFELCVSTADETGGRFLASLFEGNELACSAPGGSFGLRQPLRDSLFIGAGTGVAPLRAMILDVLDDPARNDRNLALLLGARTPERLFFSDEFQRLAAERERFEFWPTLTRPDGDWTGRRGRVLLHLAEALAGRADRTDVYVCGPPEMVADVREGLLEAGLDEGALFHEKY